MTCNPEVHYRQSIRQRAYDYSRVGAYFLTICAWQRECLFGEVVDGGMRLNDAGHIIDEMWQRITTHFSGVDIDRYIIMPNHLHGIVVINDPVGARFIAPDCHETSNKQGAINCAPTLGTIMRGFKARCTHAINQLRNTPGIPVWQRNYYERIIRDETELHAIRQYMIDNPIKWFEDENHPTRLIS